MKKLYYLFFMLIFLSACNSDDESTEPQTGYDGYTLVWSDEFDSAIDPLNWNYELGDGTDYGLPPGWGNAERQIYTNSVNNSLIQADEVGNSVLAITARKEAGEHQYSSAKLTTQGKHSFRFGRIEARIKIPVGKGFWPAFWMLGDNINEIDWPGCGEIDIMEVVLDPNLLHSTVHYTTSENKPGKNEGIADNLSSLGDDYHEYRLDWSPTEMTFSLDGIPFHTVPIEEDMKEFLRPMYLIFNVAVGGNWPGDPDESTEFPQSMLIDWVRVYSQDGLNAPATPPLDINEESLGLVSTTISSHAFNSTFNQFGEMTLQAWGGGGEPEFSVSANAIEGDSSILLSYPGGAWGGAYFIIDPVIDATQYTNGKIKFSIYASAELYDVEIKLESVGTSHSLFLKDYSGVDVGNGFMEYTIPISDFADLELTDFKIPFAIWNPVNASNEWVPLNIYIDNIYFEE